MRKRITIFLIVLVVLLFCAILVAHSISGKKEQLTFANQYLIINNTKINLSIADTPAKQIQGLSNQQSLDKNAGMLFIFPDKQIRNFWMKDMNFPLDIIWIADDKIEKIDSDLPAEGDQPKKMYSSVLPIDRVLEVNAGFCKKNKIYVSNTVQYFLQK
jgi:uncharacterized protein